MKTKQLAADATPATGGETPNTKKVQLIPTKDADLATVAKAADDKWATIPTLILLWITEPAFKALVISFTSNRTARLAAGGSREAQTYTLKDVNKQIDAGVKEVKAYLRKKFKQADTAQYARYGIEKTGTGTYLFPKDNDKRLEAIPLMQAAIIADGFGAEEFGTTFWTGVNTNFTAAYTATTSTTKNISKKVAGKDADKAQIIKVLKSLIKLIEANYPDTSDAELRNWGFIKQNY